MNAKKVKALRQRLRQAGVSHTQREYNVIKHVSQNPNKPPVALQFVLNPHSDRAQYKAAKRESR